MDYPCLWVIPSVDTSGDTTDDILKILQQQAEYLESGTNGKVMAKITKLSHIAVSKTGSHATALSSKTASKTKDLPDTNTLYQSQCYGFEIYTASYKFRIFEINLSPQYPMLITFDEGILEDTNVKLRELFIARDTYPNRYIIRSDEEFVKCLSAAFSSKKLVYLLWKLQQI